MHYTLFVIIVQAWRINFHEEKRKNDFISVIQFLCSLIIGYLKFSAARSGAALVFSIIAVATSTIVGSISFRSPPWYLNHRTAIMLTYQGIILSSWTLFIFCLPSTPLLEDIHSPAISATMLGRLRSLLFYPIFIFQASYPPILPNFHNTIL